MLNQPETYLEARVRVLEHIVEGGILSETLDLLCRVTEGTGSGMRCSVLRIDEQTNSVDLTVAPSFPNTFKDAVDGLHLGNGAVSPFTGDQVIVEDVDAHPNWQSYRQLAKDAGFRACWSQSIHSRSNEVLGKFSMYFDQVRQPSDDELRLLQSQADLAGLAIERDHKEAQLRESEMTNRALLEGSPVCNKIIDLDSRLVYMSAAGVKMLKIPDVRTHYGSVYPPDFYDEPLRAPLTEHLERAKAGETSSVECPLVSSEGDEVWLHTTFVPVCNDAGNVQYVIASSVDITERKQAEVDAYDAKSEAVKANQSKSEFLANMSHDLRTPLNAIIGFTEMMEKNIFGPLGDARYEDYAKEIRNSGNLLVSLINDILDISKIEAGQYELSEDTLDVPSIIKTSANMVSTLVKAGGLRLDTDLEPNLPLLRGDARSIIQILNNLLSNAVKFTPPEGTITISATCGDGAISVTVADGGVGMSKSDIEKAMKPFQQADSNIARSQEGTGLGLHLCQNLMKLHGGDITLQSTLGEGTIATACFPPDRTLVS